jgi:hypothetical protein
MTFSTTAQLQKIAPKVTVDAKELNTDQVIEIEHNKYYRHVYNILFPLKRPHSYTPPSQPEELFVLKDLINFYLKDPQKSASADKEIATKLVAILKDYSVETSNSKAAKDTFNNVLARCNQVINKFDFKDCEQMILLFAAYYSFYPDKLPQKLALRPQFVDLMNPIAWAQEVYHFSPEVVQHSDEYSVLRQFWRTHHQLLNLHFISTFDKPFDAVIAAKPSHFLQFPMHYRLKLIDQIMREHLITKQPYQLKNWIVFLVTVKFFEYIPSQQRKEIIDAFIQQFNILISVSTDKYANHLRILSLDAINKIYPYADLTQQDILNKQNENLVVSVYQLLTNNNKHGAITYEISSDISKEAENPVLFILSRIEKNINNLSAANQKVLIAELLAYFDKTLTATRDIHHSVATIIAEVILNLKSDELKQIIFDHILKQYSVAKSDHQKISLIQVVLKNSIHCFSEEYQRVFLDFLLDNLSPEHDESFFIDVIKNITLDNAAYIAKALVDPADNYELSPILFAQKLSDIKFRKNTIYIREIDGRIAYSLITPTGEEIKDRIVDALFAPQPMTVANANTLKPALLNITRKVGHTHSQQVSARRQRSISLIVSDICHVLPYDLQERIIANYVPMVASDLQKRNLSEFELNQSCKILLNLSPVVSEGIRDQLVDIMIAALDSSKKNQVQAYHLIKLIIQLYQLGTQKQKEKLFQAVKPFYSHHFNRNHANNFSGLMQHGFFEVLHPVFSMLDDDHRNQIIRIMEVAYHNIRDGKEWIFNAMVLIHYLLSGQLSDSLQSILKASKEKFFFDRNLHTKVIKLGESIPAQKLISFLEKVFQLLIPASKSGQHSAIVKAYIDVLPVFIKRLNPDEQIGLLRNLEAIFLANQGNDAYQNSRAGFKSVFDVIYNDRRTAKAKLQQQAIFLAAVSATLNENIEIPDINDMIMLYAGASSKNPGVNKVNVETDNDGTVLAPDVKPQSVVGVKRKMPAEEKDVKALPPEIPKQKITPKMDYFNTFITLNFAGKQQLAAELKDGILNPMIQYGAQQLLAGLGINDVYSIVVGPDYAPSAGMFKTGQGWNPSEQLKRHLVHSNYQSAKYTFCSLAVLTGNHSVAVLIDKVHKKIYCIDSLGLKGLGEQDAVIKLTAAIHDVPQLQGFTIETPKKMALPQQMDPQDPNCGIYTIRNVIGLILMLEGKEVNMPKFKGETILPTIDLITGAGLEPIRSNDLLDVWRVVIKYAYDDFLEQKRSHSLSF